MTQVEMVEQLMSLCNDAGKERNITFSWGISPDTQRGLNYEWEIDCSNQLVLKICRSRLQSLRCEEFQLPTNLPWTVDDKAMIVKKVSELIDTINSEP
jgi:hypothetical protein